MPDWKVEPKPGTPAAVFTIKDCLDCENGKCLAMEADKASAALAGRLADVDLTKTPILRWRWRAVELPQGADGRDPAKDDQAIAVCVSFGGMFSQRSVAYRWETDTPVGEEGLASYYKGIVRVKWFCVRNKENLDGKTFYVEERNVAEDLKKAFGQVPANIGIGISCNSQYTGTHAEALLDWVELAPAAEPAK